MMITRYPTRPQRTPPASMPPKTSSQKSPKTRIANIVLVFGFLFLTVFTVVMTVGFLITGTEAPTLTTCVYAFWGTELVGMLIKRIFDKRKGSGRDD